MVRATADESVVHPADSLLWLSSSKRVVVPFVRVPLLRRLSGILVEFYHRNNQASLASYVIYSYLSYRGARKNVEIQFCINQHSDIERIVSLRQSD